jgi:DNA-binding MarR family transcriptional regulator
LPSRSEHAQRVWFRWLRLQNRMEGLVAVRLKTIGLSIPQCDVLTTLTEREGISQQELAERLYVTKGNISGLIDRLAAAGHVERRSIAGDRRSHAIYLTPSGRKLADQGIALQQDFVSRTIGQLSEQQIADFEALLIATREQLRGAQ